ncbi:hypothetical protein CBS101457_002642 [Exobasidium rhododendri]|nr:hypothetical protein CBS101457_002642 [Exobasidium rhododendri]
MGNSQSATEKEDDNGESVADARLRRFNSGASDNLPAAGPSGSSALRRTSTTATGTASEKRHASLGRVSSAGVSRGTGGGASPSLGWKSGTVSATGSPRASERDKAWVRSAIRRSSTASTQQELSPSPNRARIRSGSFGNLLGGKTRDATLHEDQVLDSLDEESQAATASKRAELTFRRKKSIDLTDVLEDPPTQERVTTSGPLTSHGPRIGRRTSRDPSHLTSIASTVVNDSHAAGTTSSQSSRIDGAFRGEDDIASPIQPQMDVFNPLFPPTSTVHHYPLKRLQPTAFPSYLKIPTLIPSTYASSTSSVTSSPTTSEVKGWAADELYDVANHHPPAFPAKLGTGGIAAAAILNMEDVVIKPGGASKASTPTEELTPMQIDERVAEAVEILNKENKGEEEETAANDGPSRTPTPTPENLRGARAMTPTGHASAALSTLSPATSTTSTEPGTDVKVAPLAVEDRSLKALMKRNGAQVLFTGQDSGPNTPGLAVLPIGLTSAPSSALTPASIPTYNTEEPFSRESSLTSTPLTKATNNLRLSMPPQYRNTPTQQNKEKNDTPVRASAASQVPLMPIVVKWRGGGKEIFVTGTFANEWRSKILLKKTSGGGKKAEYSCVLHLAPGTHRLKFIVDDRWRVSRDLSTASDGEGNLTNYIEVAHTGPAHPGPLSAPGEDLLAVEGDDSKKTKRGAKGMGEIAAHKATMDLMEEARRAEALRRGDLLEVFGEDKVRKEEKWTQEIPENIIKAQAAEEAYRIEVESQVESKQHHRESTLPPSNVPVPPTLPRQLEKVILNSSPAAVAGAVDDNSVLPAPNHAVLQHLTASAIKSGVIATGCTMRYRKKYITTIYYRASK